MGADGLARVCPEIPSSSILAVFERRFRLSRLPTTVGFLAIPGALIVFLVLILAQAHSGFAVDL
jgi:hypothetical protein